MKAGVEATLAGKVCRHKGSSSDTSPPLKAAVGLGAVSELQQIPGRLRGMGAAANRGKPRAVCLTRLTIPVGMACPPYPCLDSPDRER